MECPACHYDNPSGTQFCLLCREDMLPSAVKGYQRETLRRRRIDEKNRFESTPTLHHPTQQLASFIYAKSYWLWAVIGLAIIIGGTVYYLSTITRLNLYGSRFRYVVSANDSELFLVGIESTMKSWAYRDGRMDTPLSTYSSSETGTVTLKAHEQTVQVLPREWIKSVTSSAAGTVEQTIPLNHPSLAPATVTFDSDGTLVQRDHVDSIRVGRIVNLLYPELPKGIVKVGTAWTEHVQWNETVGEWSIHWQADLHWTVQNFQPCYQDDCVHMVYQADLSPTIKAFPTWASHSLGTTSDMSGTGDVLFDPKTYQLLSHRFSYTGALSIPIAKLEDIPWDQRVGNYTTTGPGSVRLELDERVDVRRP